MKQKIKRFIYINDENKLTTNQLKIYKFISIKMSNALLIAALMIALMAFWKPEIVSIAVLLLGVLIIANIGYPVYINIRRKII